MVLACGDVRHVYWIAIDWRCAVTTAIIAIVIWLIVASLIAWVAAQCIGAMEEPDPMEQINAETEALLKRLNKETS